MAVVCNIEAFVLKVNRRPTPNTLRIIADAFETFKMMPDVESITVHPADKIRGDRVFVAAHVVCRNGVEVWGTGSGSGMIRACEN